MTYSPEGYILSAVKTVRFFIEKAKNTRRLFSKEKQQFHTWWRWNRYFRQLRRLAKEIRKKEEIKVLFIAFNLSNWKHDSLFRAMQAHSRFSPSILIVPEMQVTALEQREQKMRMLMEYCRKNNYPFFTLCNTDGDTQGKSIPAEYDILIYAKPYLGAVPTSLDYPLYRDRLLLAIHYACHSVDADWACNQPYQKWAWMDFYENDSTARGSALYKECGKRNNVVTGLPVFDAFMLPPTANPWKAQSGNPKKIIWAPHWTLSTSKSWLGCYSNFLSMAEPMRNLAKTTQGTFQWAFKPHPLLKHTLYSHPDWGKAKTDEYWEWWAMQINTQLEEGEYSDLFQTSDAMIHDSCSFSCEYHFTGKPVLFICNNIEQHIKGLNDMATAGFLAQYIGKGMEEVKIFLHETLLQSIDPKRNTRLEFRARYLLPPKGQTAADNIIHAILYR